MGALAYVDQRGVLVIIDSAGRKSEVRDSRGALLPGWSPDGRRIAFLLFDRGLRLEVADVKERDAR
jgi:Tol biopolymer transport system component